MYTYIVICSSILIIIIGLNTKLANLCLQAVNIAEYDDYQNSITINSIPNHLNDLRYDDWKHT